MSLPSTMTSPELMPMRNSIRLSGGSPVLRSPIAAWISTAHCAASMRGDLGLNEFPAARLEAGERALLVRAHQARVAYDIGSKDCGESALDLLPMLGVGVSHDRRSSTATTRIIPFSLRSDEHLCGSAVLDR